MLLTEIEIRSVSRERRWSDCYQGGIHVFGVSRGTKKALWCSAMARLLILFLFALKK